MITIELPKWVPIGGLTLVSTSYQVAADIGFTNIVDNHPNDTVNLNTYFSPVVVPAGATYYARVNRAFSDGSTSGWGQPMPITNNTANGGVIAYTPIVVHQPVVSVDAALNDRLFTSYTVSTSNFVGVNEAHGYTVWMVEDDQGKLIEYVKSNTALTSMAFNKRPNMHLGTKYIKVSAVHGTLSGIESPAGSVTYDLSTADFSLSVPNPEGSPGINLIVTLHYPPLGGVNTVINNLELQDANEAVVWSTPVAAGATSVTVPGDLLLDDTQYFIVAHGPDVAGGIASKMIPFKAMSRNNVIRLNPAHVYKKTIRSVGYGIYTGSTGRLVTSELFNGKFLDNAGAGVVETSITPAGEFVLGTKPYNGLSLVPTAHALVLHNLSGDRAIIAHNNNATPGTLYNMYKVDFYNNKLVPTGGTLNAPVSILDNNAMVINGESVMYVAGTGHVSVIDITAVGLVASAVNNIPYPTGVTTLATMCRGQGNTLLVIPTGGINVMSLDLNNHTYVDKHVLPVSFRNRTLCQRELINGDVVIWKPLVTENVNGVSVTDTTLEMLYIDNKNGTMQTIVPYTGRTNSIQVSVLRSSGELLLIDVGQNTPNVLVFE